ncbi:MAG: hypothetical protein U0905_05335 [Pirellulales bacterium]
MQTAETMRSISASRASAKKFRLADLSFDSDAGTDVAARGVYLSVDPQATSVFKREGKKFMAKAIESGKVRADLLSVFEARYDRIVQVL